jgi:signal transduction histidine kinase
MADRRQVLQNARVGLAKWLMGLALPLVFGLAWLDLRRDQERALAEFTEEQITLAEALADTLQARLPERPSPDHVFDGMSFQRQALMRCLVLDGNRFVELGLTPASGAIDDPALFGEVRALFARMAAGETGAATLSRAAAASLGLDPRMAVAGFAPVRGERWSVAVVASAKRLRDRDRIGQWRLAAATGLAATLVGLFGLIVARQQRRAIELTQALKLSEATAALRERSEKIVENIPIGVCAFDSGGAITSVNPYLAARGLKPGGAVPDEIGALIEEARRTRQVVERVALQLPLGGDEPREIDAYAVPLEHPLPDADCFLVLHDRTDLRLLERRLARAEKLGTIGTLAAGVAHEVGTPLGIISGRAEQALARATDEASKKSLGSILTQVDKVSTTIRQLLDFARVRPVEAGAVAAAAILEVPRALLEHRFRQAKVRLSIDAPTALPPILGDAGQLEQVFVNLLINAVDACSEGGTVSAGVRERGERLRFEIRDNGCGIAPENLPHVVDPFFTTKKRGQGTGLGLSIAADIVKNHGGTLDIESEPGKGTVVAVELPIARLS